MVDGLDKGHAKGKVEGIAIGIALKSVSAMRITD